MKNFIVLILLFSGGLIQGQEINLKYGKVSNVDFTIDSGSQDEPAVVLLRDVNISFIPVDNKLNQLRVVHERIRINSEEGLDYATKKIRLYNSRAALRERIKIKGATYNLVDGEPKRTKLKSTGTFNEELNDKWRQESFTMPAAKVGSVIEFKYTITSPFFEIDEIPIQYDVKILNQKIKIQTSEYLVHNLHFNPSADYVPQFGSDFKREKITRGDLGSTQLRSQQQLLTLEVTNVPALSSEPMAGGMEKYRAKLIMELAGTRFDSGAEDYTTSWDVVGKKMMSHKRFGKQLKSRKYFQEDLNNLLSTPLKPQEKITAIFTHAKSKVKWDGWYGKLTKTSLEQAYKKGSGNVADVNLLLVSMLRAAGFEANPVLVSSKNNGIPLFPTQNGFDYVIVHVSLDGNGMLLDATAPWAGHNMLPERARNWNGRLVKDSGISEWIPLSSLKSVQSLMVKAQLDPESGTVTGDVQRRETKYLAMRARNSIAMKPLSKQEDFLAGDNAQLSVDSLDIQNLLNPYKPISYKYVVEQKNSAEEIGDKIYVSPLLFEAARENQFKLENRKFPLNLSYPIKTSVMVNIAIPEGYQVESMPESQKYIYGDDAGSYTYLISNKNNLITTRATFELDIDVISPQDYSMFREFFMSVVNKEAEKIVLKQI
ncbi:MAG: DUF3858 domain-containing protein [Nonlabens sp.]